MWIYEGMDISEKFYNINKIDASNKRKRLFKKIR
jgi:hypothetical protein